ncbi:hypothetical protein EMCRGX_G025894 [Ephydatia muelleri]
MTFKRQSAQYSFPQDKYPSTETPIHFVQDSFHSAQCKAVLLVDANNANNAFNIQRSCPSFATVLINTPKNCLLMEPQSYQGKEQLRVTHLPCLCTLWALCHSYSRLLGTSFNYADDVTAIGTVSQLKQWVPPNDLNRLLFSLPQRLGGLGITICIELSANEYSTSMSITKPLCNLILAKNTHYPPSI